MAKHSGKGFDGLSNIDTGIDEILKVSISTGNESPKSDSNTFFLLAIGMFFVIVLVVIGLSSKSTTTFNHYTQSTSQTKQPSTTSLKTTEAQENSFNSEKSYGTTKRSICSERQPTAYTTILDKNELCYCLAEKIRLDSAKTVLNPYSQSDINQYNTKVQDYNLVCKNKKYYNDDLRKAERDIEARTYILKEAGKSLFKNSSSHDSCTTTKAYNNSSYSLSYNSAPTYEQEYFLTIKPTPSDARVQIMNIEPKYYDGIRLKEGRYDIKVSKKGYKTVRTWINLQENESYTVTLVKI